MVCMSHLMHWDAHVFHTMNAKSQLACEGPFSNAEVLHLPRILSRDNSTQRNFESFFLLFYLFDLTLILQWPSLFPSSLFYDTIGTDFGSLVHQYVCLLVLQRCIFQFAAQMNVRHHTSSERRLKNPWSKCFFNLYYWTCQYLCVSPNHKKQTTMIWLPLIRGQIDALLLCWLQRALKSWDFQLVCWSRF